MKDLLNLKGVTTLSKKQQQLVFGGLLKGTCAFEGGSGYAGMAGVSKDRAMASAAALGGHWCCDSCQSASWLSQDNKNYLAEM